MACACVHIYLFILFYILTTFQIINCLHEYELGTEVTTPFTGDRYESIYQAMVGLIEELEKHAYHGAKLEKLLEKIATDGQCVKFMKLFTT